MKEMLEIVIHGRGGQGAKTAGQLLVEAANEKGKQVQAFPEYGPERTGAPMKTYARVSDRPIKTYAPVTKPDIVMVIDPTLMGQIDFRQEAGNEGMLIINTDEDPGAVKKETGFRGRVCTIDATGISIKHVGRNLPNMPMLGALIKVTGVVELDSLIGKVRKKFTEKIGEEKTEANVAAVKQAYEEVGG